MLGSLVPLSALNNASPLEYVGGTVLAAAAASITVPVLPSYTVLVVECEIVKDATGNSIYLTLNGDGGANYDRQRVLANSTTISGARTTGATSITLAQAALRASTHGLITLIIVKSTTGTDAQVLTSASHEDTTPVLMLELQGAEWNNTSAAITSLSITATSGNLAADTTIAVYGLRG